MNSLANKIDLTKIKLIIWDLDDTFWQGTLAEKNAIRLSSRNIELIDKLVNKGIMNSICSKNDFKNVEAFFLNQKLKDTWEQFVFSSISWEPKGQRIKTLISNMQLRDENVLFIDDNLSNLNEASFYCPNIKTMLPEDIHLISEQINDITKDDTSHSRLQQYKILEVKHQEKESSSSNEEFLYKSNIIVEINTDCLSQIERITELVNRTNQLNFTKIRASEEEIKDLLNNSDYQNGYISVKDNFGDYGIIGFYSLSTKTNTLLHFLFSCRTLGMGIEQYVYSKLNYPILNVAGEVVGNVEKNKTIDWINKNCETDVTANNQNAKFSVLFKGPCDLQSTLPYLQMDKKNVTLEFSSLDDENLTTMSAICSHNIVNSLKYAKEDIENILKEAPFLSKETFKQTIFDNKYDFIIFSLIPDCGSVLYKNKKTGKIIAISGIHKPFTTENLPFTDRKNWEYYCKEKPLGHNWTEKELERLSNLWDFVGDITADQIIDNLKNIMEKVPKDSYWIFTLGSEVKPNEDILKSSPVTKFCWNKYKELNLSLRRFINNQPNATYINLGDIVKSSDHYTDSVQHFTRNTYFEIAKEIVNKMNSFKQIKTVKTTSKFVYQLKGFRKKYIRPITRFMYSTSYKTSDCGVRLVKYRTVCGIKIKIKDYMKENNT